EYLYTGSDDFQRDDAYYRGVLGARRIWAFSAFDAKVAAYKLTDDGPLVLIADHKEAPSCQPIFSVPDLEATANELKSRGWKADGPSFGVPDGTAYSFTDPSGNRYAFMQIERPHQMDQSYADQTNERAIRD